MIKVLVTGVGGGGVGEQVVKSLKLHPGRYQIAGADITKYSIGLRQVSRAYVLPPASDPEYIDALLNACATSEAEVLVPGSEPELRVISVYRDVFERSGILLLINSKAVIDTCMNKWSTYLTLKNNGFNTPESHLLDRSTDASVKFPAVVKPAVGGGGSFNCYMAQDREELDFFAEYIRKQGLLPIAQQYIGTADDEYTVGVLTDQDSGELLGSIALRRQIRMGMSNRMRVRSRANGETLVVSSGISQGEFGAFPEVRRECERIAQALCSKGPLNVQCRVQDGKVYAFEINPRLSGTTYPRAMVGHNETDVMIRRKLLNEDVRPDGYRYGMVLRGLVERFMPCCDE